MARARDYKLPDVKKLFALSDNECASPVCEHKMISDDGKTVLGEICHISGANPKGPRWREELCDDYRRDYDNLILLCSSCHKEIDNKNNENQFTETILLSWKKAHLEKTAGKTLDVDESIAEQALQKLEEWFEAVGIKLDRIQEDVQNIHSEIQKLPQKISEQQEQVDVNIILTEFKNASYALRSCENWFGNIYDSHLERNETKNLRQWIAEPLKPNNSAVCLVTGNAGVGKTIILKDLQAQLELENIPVLGIKSDRQFAQNRKDLEQQLSLSHALRISIETLLKDYERLVILIDQIDALSLSQSTDTRFIDSYLQLTHEFSRFEKIRIILTIREFDLKYNPSLKFPSHHHTVKVDLLSEAEVRDVIGKLDFDNAALSNELIHILRTPLHLNIFCKIHSDIIDFHNIKSLNDLYHELWRQKVSQSNELGPDDRTTAKQLLFKLVDRASTGVQVSVNSAFLDECTEQLDYLCSCGLITKSKSSIHFFHQSFHDYLFSRQFVEKGQSLSEFILNSMNA